jgi:hypothetical protein
VWDEALLIAGVVLFPLPALALGARGLFRHRGYVTGDPNDRASVVVLVTLRSLVLLLVLALSGITLVSCIGAWVKDVLLTFGRGEQRPARRRASPARR